MRLQAGDQGVHQGFPLGGGGPSVAIAKDVYGHLVEGQKRAAAEIMSAQLLREIGSQDGSQ